MLDPYRRVLSRPGAALFSATGLVARMPISMMTLAVVLLVTAETRSYTLAGQVSAAFVIANALAAIPHGRLLDRLGQSRVLFVDSLVFALGSGMLGYAIVHDWSEPWPHLAAVVAGLAMPPIGSSVRARWTHLLPDPREKQTAFAVESVADEAVFMSGPTLVTFLSTLWTPVAGLGAAVVLGTLGTLGLAAQRGTEPPAHPRSPDPALRAPMPWLRLSPLALGAAALGSLFGATEVATVAFARGERAHGDLRCAARGLGAGEPALGRAHGRDRVEGDHDPPVLGRRPGAHPGDGADPVRAEPLDDGRACCSSPASRSPPRSSPCSRRSRRSRPAPGSPRPSDSSRPGSVAGIAPGAALAGFLIDDHGSAPAYGVAVLSGAVAALSGLLAVDRRRAAPAAGEPGAPILRP